MSEMAPRHVSGGEGDPGEPLGARRRLGFLMRDSARLMRRRFVQMARETGLPVNQSEATALVHIAEEPGLHQASLALKLDVEPIVMVRLLDGLQEAGLIERRAHEHDRRMRTIWPTEAAYPVLARIDAIRMEVRDEALAGLPAPERERLLDALERIRENLGRESGVKESSAIEPPAAATSRRKGFAEGAAAPTPVPAPARSSGR